MPRKPKPQPNTTAWNPQVQNSSMPFPITFEIAANRI